MDSHSLPSSWSPATNVAWGSGAHPGCPLDSCCASAEPCLATEDPRRGDGAGRGASQAGGPAAPAPRAVRRGPAFGRLLPPRAPGTPSPDAPPRQSRPRCFPSTRERNPCSSVATPGCLLPASALGRGKIGELGPLGRAPPPSALRLPKGSWLAGSTLVAQPGGKRDYQSAAPSQKVPGTRGC